jgi:hypothetical protein
MRPMRRRIPLPFLLFCPLMVGLPACHAEVKGDNGAAASISIGNDADHGDGSGNGQSVSINVPGFSGKMTVPGLNLGDDAKIDDMPFFPGTKVTGINVTGESGDGSGGRGKGHVDMAFTAPGNVDALAGWYRDQAQQHGWTVVPPAGGNQFEATKDKADGTSRFAVQMAPQGTGSAGHFLVSGS